MNAENGSSPKISEMAIIREVNIQAENFYDKAVDLGDHAAYVLLNKHRSQMTSLEAIAESTLKVTDIFDFIKKQTARLPQWRLSLGQESTNPGFGESLRDQLENKLKGNLNAVCNHLEIKDNTDDEKQLRRRIYLLLIRQFIRQMVVEYEYQASLKSNGERK
jgi:ATP-dependent Clp protease ATP-binding subunit ClpA